MANPPPSPVGFPILSGDGRFVVFGSSADNLVPGDTNGVSDVFLLERATASVVLLSASSAGALGNGGSSSGVCSGDGRFVAFTSYADNLAPGDPDKVPDVYVRDTLLRTTELISRRYGSGASLKGCGKASISRDGRFVAFGCGDDNVVPGDVNSMPDVFVHDRRTGRTELVSVDQAGVQGNIGSSRPSISADGRFVAFDSGAWNWFNLTEWWPQHIYVKDRWLGTLELITRKLDGTPATGPSHVPSFSSDGRFVAFVSNSTDLLPQSAGSIEDVYLHDLRHGVTLLASANLQGVSSGSYGGRHSISADGRYVAFESSATDLTPAGGDGHRQVFLFDRLSAATTLVSEGPISDPLQNGWFPSISGDGRVIAYLRDKELVWRECSMLP